MISGSVLSLVRLLRSSTYSTVWRLSAEASASRIFGMAPGAELSQLGEQLLAVGRGRIRFLTNLRDEPIGL